jgi:hypothetical protein
MTVSARLYRRGKWVIDPDGAQSLVDVWEIKSTSETETIANLLAASGLPAKGDAHDENAGAVCIDLDMDHDDGVLNLWYLNAKYSTKQTTREFGPYDSQRTKGGMKSASKQVPAFYDARGYPLVNTAGDLYEGLTRKRRLRVVNVTHNFDEIPNWFFELADTINSANVTIHGKVYPAGCCLLTDIDMPDEPTTDEAGNDYWPVTYSIQIDPDGYFIVLPNKGLHEYVYQTRSTSTLPQPSSDPWIDTTKAVYDAETTAAKKNKIKRRILTDEQQELAQDIWLNADGQARRVVALTPTQLGTGTITAGSTSLTLATGTLDAAIHTGALIRFNGAGPLGRWLTTQIAAVTSPTTATLASKATTAVGTAKAIFVSGAIVNYFVMEDIADWSAVPLPNNQPGA